MRWGGGVPEGRAMGGRNSSLETTGCMVTLYTAVTVVGSYPRVSGRVLPCSQVSAVGTGLWAQSLCITADAYLTPFNSLTEWPLAITQSAGDPSKAILNTVSVSCRGYKPAPVDAPLT